MQDIVSSPIFLTNSFSYLSNSHGFYHVSIPAGRRHSDEMYILRLTFSKSVPRKIHTSSLLRGYFLKFPHRLIFCIRNDIFPAQLPYPDSRGALSKGRNRKSGPWKASLQDHLLSGPRSRRISPPPRACVLIGPALETLSQTWFHRLWTIFTGAVVTRSLWLWKAQVLVGGGSPRGVSSPESP